MDYKLQMKNLLDIAIKSNASDLHISCGHPPILRVSTVLVEVEGEPVITPAVAQGLVLSVLNENQQQQLFKEREIDFAYNIDSIARFRVNAFFQSNMLSMAMRLIPSRIRTIEELNLPPVLYKFTRAKQGCVLITGATSQGKSTTLAALIDEINHTRREHIITIEHPIEYVFQDDKSIIDQREVYQDTLSFAKALRSTLREDPNVIMVGEMRDFETIATAITAAETGHLVFATLHTNSASQTIHRIIDVFPPHQQSQIRAQLASSLLGVVAQRLIPRIDDGFIPACEIMLVNPAIANLVREDKIHEIPAIIETSAKQGMISMNQSLSDLVRAKQVSKETAVIYSLSPEDLEARLKSI
ncbi:MAG: type IV pilus twitching motility protein PilT [Candidatus Pacebacteria bacterium]|nr:type IV pilus twitching motility protein PilT [Candidatus Paceibacterota bacterium]